MFVLGAIALLLNAWLVRRGWFRPMPRLISNLVTIAALIYVIHELPESGSGTIMLIGEFLILLQMVKLWEQRGNRDYAQLLVLSLLLMVAACITTPSFIFGALMLIYLFISLYCCLLFHLKVESDAARAAIAAPERKISPAVLRQDQRKLSQSMRKLTIVVSSVTLFFAVAIFILFPRGTGAGMFGPSQYKATQAMTGLSDEVKFEDFGRIQQNDAIVAYVTLEHNGQPVKGTVPLLLRGVLLDTYLTGDEGSRWARWSRPLGAERQPDPFELPQTGVIGPGDPPKALADGPEPKDAWRQHITLLPTGTNVLFAIAGPYSIQSMRQLAYRFSRRDGELRNDSQEHDPHEAEVRYTIISSGDLGAQRPPPESGTPYPFEGVRRGRGSAEEKSDLALKEIRAYIDRNNAAGSFARGSLAAARKHALAARERDAGAEWQPDELDEQIAQNFEGFLKDETRSHLSYTLDLSGTEKVKGRDRVVAFLEDFQKGHCEYFAAAMTLMCQSVGMKARMCLGFRCSEYNGTPGAGYYIVRQSHAHAWVEVCTPSGWKTFDPTSEYEAKKQADQEGFWQKVKHVFDFLQYAYGNAVIGNDDRGNLLQRAETAMARAVAGSRSGGLSRFHLNQILASTKYWKISSAVILAVILLVGLMAVALIVRYVRDRWQLRRRAARIGIDSLPREQQLRLARQLAFYDDLVSLLGRHKIHRQPHQTPLEFSESLLFLPSGVYNGIRRLTDVFYRVRYGQAELTPARQRRLGTVIERMAGELET